MQNIHSTHAGKMRETVNANKHGHRQVMLMMTILCLPTCGISYEVELVRQIEYVPWKDCLERLPHIIGMLYYYLYHRSIPPSLAQ